MYVMQVSYVVVGCMSQPRGKIIFSYVPFQNKWYSRTNFKILEKDKVYLFDYCI